MLFDIITESNAKYYTPLIPEVYINMMSIPGVVSIGAAMESETGDECQPAGVMIMDIHMKDRLCIEFMQVNPDYREQEIGTLLLEQAFDLAKEMGITKLEARIPELEVEEACGLEDTRAYFFLRRGFVPTDKNEREWWFPVESLAPYKFADLGKEEKNLVSFDKLSEAVYVEVMKKLEKDLLHLRVPFVEESMEKKFSFAYIEDEKLMGFVICERFKDTYYPCAYSNLSGLKKVETALIRKLLCVASNDEDEYDYVHVKPSGEVLRDSLEKRLAYIPCVRMRVLEAEVDNMESMEKHINDMMESEEQTVTEDEEFPKSFRVIGYEYYGGEVDMLE